MATNGNASSSVGRGRCGRGRGGGNQGGFNNAYNSRGFSNGITNDGAYYNCRRLPLSWQQRRSDPEEDLLRLINSEFQINCCQYRSLEDIWLRVKTDDALFRFIQQNQEKLVAFINRYPLNFRFDAECPEIVIWNPDARLAALTDRKEAQRVARRRWDKEYEEKASTEFYDPVHEEAILRFVMALFKTGKDNWLRLDLVSKAVKQAFYTDGDLLDYIGGEVGAFLSKRDYLFRIHLEMILFQGREFADLAYALNEEIRDNDYQGTNRMPFARLYEIFLNSPNIADAVRKEFKSFIEDKRQLANFLANCSWVFQMEGDTAHVKSKRILPSLQWNRPLDKSLQEVVRQFAQLHRQEDLDESSQNTYDPEDFEDFYSDAGGRSSAAKKSASAAGGKKRGDSSSSSSICTERSGATATATPLRNPFSVPNVPAIPAAPAAAAAAAASPPRRQRDSPAPPEDPVSKNAFGGFSVENPFNKWK